MKRIITILLIIYVAIATTYCAESDSLKNISLDSIIISGIKYTNNQLKFPVSATTVSQREMQADQLNSVKDFSAFVPNFVMIDRDTRLTSSVFVRGVGALINAPGVAMYVDGIPHFEKSSFDINLADVEKIEFLRGPQGTLYGRNAMGGIILVHTRSPFRYQGTRLNLRYGAYNEVYAMLSRSAKINDRLGYTVSADYNHLDGYVTNVYSGKKTDGLNSGSVNTRVEWRPRVNMNFRLTNNFEYTGQGAFAYGDVNEKGNGVDSVSLDHESSYTRKLYDGGLRFDYHTDLMWVYSLTSFQWLDDRYDVDQDASPRDMYFAVQAENQRLWSQEINMKNLYSDVYSWHFGLFAFNHAIDRSTDVFMDRANPKYMLDKSYDDYNRGIAAYHQSTLKLGALFTLEAGIRYDLERANSKFRQDTIVEGTRRHAGIYDEPLTFSQWTPKVSLQYHFNRDGHLYATFSKGYKTGGFNTVFETESDRTFGPESSWNYEVGLKTALFRQRVHVEAALFYIRLNNQQIKQMLPETGVKIRNAGTSVNKGMEFSLHANPVNPLRLWMAYGLTHARFNEYTVYNSATKVNEDYAGKFAPFVPRNTVSLGAQYDFVFRGALVDKLSLNCNYKGMGKMYWNEDNKAVQPFYGLWNAQITASKANVDFSVWGRNLTGTKYLGYYFESGARKLGKAGKPLTAGASVTCRF